MSQKKSISKNAILNGIRQALNFLFPLITFPYISRTLSVESAGIYNFSNTYVNYFVLFAGLGISTYSIREGAKYRDDKKQFSMFSCQVFTINIVSTMIAYTALFVSLLMFENLDKYRLCITLFSIQIIFTTLGTEWVYTIYEDFSYITLRSIAFKIISIAFLFIFVRSKDDFLAYAGVTVFATVGSNLLNFIHARSIVNIRLTRHCDVKKHLKPILIIFLSSIAITIYVSSDTTILGLLKNDYAVGIYGVSSKIYMIIVQLLAAVVVVTVPRLSMLFGKRMMEEYYKVLGSVINILIVLAFPVGTGLIMLAKKAVLIIAGSKYLESTLPLKMLSIAMLFSIFNTVVCNCVLLPAKRENKVFAVNIICALLNITGNLILIPRWSYNAAAFTTVISEGLGFAIDTILARGYLKNIIKPFCIIKNILQVLMGCAAIIIICYICNQCISSTLVTTFVSIVCSLIAYVLVLLMMKNTSIKYIMKTLRIVQ